MAKRRRERDRPKAGPHKRVLLSYDSDDDHGPENTTAQQNVAPQTGGSTAHRKDYDTNQLPVLGLADDEDDEYDSTTEQAMAYLRSVNEERWTMPDIFSVPRHVVSQPDGDGLDVEEADDQEGWDEDRTCIGRPGTAPATTADDVLDPQYVFTTSLKHRFHIRRDVLRAPPEAGEVDALGQDHPISLPQGNDKAYAEWHRLLASKPPKTAQLQSLDQETVVSLLALLQKAYLVKGTNLRTATSAWLWSLLAKLDDVGSMNNDQVYPLRELGKKAIILQLHFSDPEAAAQLEELQQNGADSPEINGRAEHTHKEDDERVQRPSPSASDQANSRHATASENTLATLDMIIVVIGDIFGQRDLLEFRQPWTKTCLTEAAVAA